MLKTILLTLLVSLSLLSGDFSVSHREVLPTNDDLTLELKDNSHYKVTGVNDTSLEEFRIYYDENTVIDEISEGAFDSCLSLTTLMISYSVNILPANLFTDSTQHTDFETINYTGTKAEWDALLISYSYDINYEACDEGFIRMWNRDVRPTSDSSLCDIGKVKYLEVIALYENLSDGDRLVVNAYRDLNDVLSETGNIASSISYLKDYYTKGDVPSSNETKEVSSSLMISLIVVIAVVGMTFIMIFYYLKDKKIIE